MKPLDNPPALDEDEAFAVWPFRRHLVDRFARADVATPAVPPEGTQPFAPPWLAPSRLEPPRPRTRPSVIRFAAPAALVAFFAALAGAAAMGNAGDVQQRLGARIVPAAEAASQPVATRHARPKARRPAVTRPRSVFVPDVVGLKRQKALGILAKKRFKVRVVPGKGKPGLVLAQRPKAATRLARPGRLVLTIGRPKPKPKPRVVAPPTPRVIVASVVGLARPTAVAALRNLRLAVRVAAVPSSQPHGTVVAQSIRSGTRIEAGAVIRINVAA